LQRKVGRNRIGECGITADEQVILSQSQRLGVGQVDMIGKADGEGAARFCIADPPAFIRGCQLRHRRSQRKALPQGDFPDDIVRLPAGNQRIGEGLHLLEVAFRRLVLHTRPAPDVRSAQSESAKALIASGNIGKRQNPTQPFTGDLSDPFPALGERSFASPFLGVYCFRQLHANIASTSHTASYKADDSFTARTRASKEIHDDWVVIIRRHITE